MARSQRFLYVLCVPHFASHSQKSMDKITQFNLLTEQTLPTRARELHWPIRLDHCFKRICLDHAFQAPWHTKIPRPAYRHLRGDPLDRALTCAQSLTTGTRELLDRLNRESLTYRNKLKP